MDQVKPDGTLMKVGSKRCHSLTEDSYLIPQLGSGPDRTTSGSGYLTYDDYVELLKYAKARHVEVIPEIDMPGHARAAIISMEARYRKLMKLGQEEQAKKFRLIDPLDDSRYLSVQYFNDNAMNPCLESTFTFVTHVVFEIFKMHMSANYPLNKVHFGGDEVAKTAWINSTACNNIPLNVDKRAYLKKYFVQRVSKLAEYFGVDLIEWEDGLMDTDGKPFPRATFENTEIYSNAWDNVWEWGAADRAYNLANAGYKVIMSHATHLYFDHPYEPDPEERGLYWAPRFTDTMKTFGFLPDNLYENIDVTRMGEPLNRTTVCGPDNIKCPALQNRSNIAGIQGHLWSETVLSEDDFYYMVFPRVLALAERAWHKAPWETSLNKTERNTMIKEDWDDFALTVGSKELKRLDEAGIKYRVPPPGARKRGLLLETNTAYPGLIVEHRTDGNTWKTGNITGLTGAILLRTRSADGQRFSRVVTYTEPTVTEVTTTTSPNKEKKDKINKGHKGRGKGHGLYKSKNHEDKKDKTIKGHEEPKRGQKSKKSKGKGHNGHSLPGHGREKSKGKGRN